MFCLLVYLRRFDFVAQYKSVLPCKWHQNQIIMYSTLFNAVVIKSEITFLPSFSSSFTSIFHQGKSKRVVSARTVYTNGTITFGSPNFNRIGDVIPQIYSVLALAQRTYFQELLISIHFPTSTGTGKWIFLRKQLTAVCK